MKNNQTKTAHIADLWEPNAPEDDGYWETLEERAKWEPCPPDLFLDNEDMQ